MWPSGVLGVLMAALEARKRMHGVTERETWVLWWRKMEASARAVVSAAVADWKETEGCEAAVHHLEG